MSARADLDTIDGDVRCRVTTDSTSVAFVLTPLEAMALADALVEYSLLVLTIHASQAFENATTTLTRRKMQ